MADRVLDGTPCGPYETDLCVHGRCQVTCFLCVLGGVLERRFLFPEVLVLGQEPREALGEWIFSRRHRGATCCSLGSPLLPPPTSV